MKNRAILVALALLLNSGLSAAQDDPTSKVETEQKKFSDWTVQCTVGSSNKRCVMGQAIQKKVSEKAAISIALEIGRISEDKKLAMIVTAPLGVLLPPGLQIKIDAGKPIRVPFQICAQGCLAVMPMDAKLIAALKKGKEAKVAIAVGGDKGIALPISLSGFTKAFNYFSSQEKK